MTKRDRREDRRDNDRRESERRDGQSEAEHPRGSGQQAQESESLAALKAILAKVASLLKPLQLTPEESIRLVEQLYGSILEMDAKLAGEADEARNSSVLAHIQNAVIRREDDRVVVEFGAPPQTVPPESTPAQASSGQEASPASQPEKSQKTSGAPALETAASASGGGEDEAGDGARPRPRRQTPRTKRKEEASPAESQSKDSPPPPPEPEVI